MEMSTEKFKGTFRPFERFLNLYFLKRSIEEDLTASFEQVARGKLMTLDMKIFCA